LLDIHEPVGITPPQRLFSNEFEGSPRGGSSLAGFMSALASRIKAPSPSAGGGAGIGADGGRRPLTRAEFRVVHERITGTPISDEEAEVLFDFFDADLDGRLAVEEVGWLTKQT
jgi:hypothetical protein